jgi:hypothetical protein
MRFTLASATLLLLPIAGCTTTMTPPPEGPHSAGEWRVVPIQRAQGETYPPAILINERTGETWKYDFTNNEWRAIKRAQ